MPSSTPHRFTLAYIGALSLVALVCLGSYTVLGRGVDRLSGYAALANGSGRQRMGVLHVAYLAHTMAAGHRAGDHRGELAAAIERLAAQHRAIAADAQRNLPGAAELFDGPAGLDALVGDYLDKAAALIHSPDDTALFAALDAAAEPLIARLDELVVAYEEESSAQSDRLNLIHRASLATVLASLLAVAALIFRPIVARLAHETGELAMLSLVARQSGAAVLISDSHGRTEWVNERFTQITGYTLDELRGRHPGELLRGPATDPAVAQAIDQALWTGAAAGGELLNYRKDGSPVWIELSITPVHDDAGRITRFIAVQNDVSHRHTLEEALRESEARYRAVVGALAEGVVMHSAEGAIVACNESAEQVLGLSADQLMGSRSIDPRSRAVRADGSPFPGEEHPAMLSLCDGAPRNDVVMGIHTPDGGLNWLSVNSRPLLRPGEDRPYGVVASFFDISARVRAEAALREAMALNQAILDAAGHLIIATGPDGLIQRVNPAVERALGYRADELLGRASMHIFHDPDEVARGVRELRVELADYTSPDSELLVRRALAGGVDEREWTFIRKDGSRFPVSLAVTALRGADGGPGGYVGIASDITERRTVDRLKREFISTVSHELRTPLTSIRGALGLLAGGVAGPLPAQAGAMTDIALKNSERLVRLINDILDIERIETGKMRFQLRPTKLLPLVAQALEANRSFAADLHVRLVLDPDARPATVNADPDRLNQVLTNLLSNAAKFSPAGSTVTVRLLGGPGRARIEVEDCGSGVPAAFQGRIFQQFAQADSSNTRARGGSGLGLSISRAIVEHHEGHIGFENLPCGGCVFFVELPTVEELAAAPRVLVVEDDPDVADFIAELLDEAGYQVDLANSTAAARERIRQRRYNGVTLDLYLPGDGVVDLIRELRASTAARPIPIVVVSAWAEQGRSLLSSDVVGVVDWVAKPIDRDRLVRALGGAVPAARAEPQA